MKIELKVIVDAFESISNSFDLYLNVKTGEILFLPGIGYIGDTEDFEEDIEMVESSDDYVKLPEQYELRELDIIRMFIDSINLDTIKIRLYHSINRSHPFRNFKHEAIKFGVMNDYYDFRRKEYERKARRWCRDNNIEYEE